MQETPTCFLLVLLNKLYITSLDSSGLKVTNLCPQSKSYLLMESLIKIKIGREHPMRRLRSTGDNVINNSTLRIQVFLAESY